MFYIFIPLRRRLINAAFDGQYHLLGVPKHFQDTIGVSDDARDWTSFHWDPAHLIELAKEDATQDPSGDWVQRTEKIIKDVNKTYS